MITKSGVDRAVERIVALYDPDVIYVFGSYAKDRLNEGSDLDLVVVRASDQPRWMRGRDVIALLGELAFDIDLLFVTPEELAVEVAEPYSLLRTVMPTATVLYRRGG